MKTEKSQNQEDPINIHTKEENISVETVYSIFNQSLLPNLWRTPQGSGWVPLMIN